MKFLTKEQFQKLNTKRLLAYKNKLMTYPENGCEFAGCDCTPYKISKSHPDWQKTYKELKEVLATREHVE